MSPFLLRFQTELLGIVMDHLVAADVLIGDQAALPIVSGGNLQNIAPNVFYLASRLVDKLWQGVFKKDPDEIFEFILKLIAQAKRRSGVTGGLSLEGIYRCLNRTILYMLSRPHHAAGVASQVSTLEVLHKVTTNRSIIFGAGNHELEFFGCLTFCLLQIGEGLEIPTEGEKAEHKKFYFFCLPGCLACFVHHPFRGKGTLDAVISDLKAGRRGMGSKLGLSRVGINPGCSACEVDAKSFTPSPRG